jgi:carboxymethylenebutenolidase
LFEMLKPNYALANQVPEDDKRITSQTVSIPSPEGNGKIDGYLVRPAGSGKLPAIMVVHENRGLNPYIKDVAILRTWRGAWPWRAIWRWRRTA